MKKKQEKEIQKEICLIARRAHNLLAAKDYSSLEIWTSGERLSATDIDNAVKEYGGTIKKIDEYDCSKLDIVKVTGKDEYSVYIPIYTDEEGISDLTMEMSIISPNGRPLVSIDNIHVL